MAIFDPLWIERWRRMVNNDEVAQLIGRHFDANILIEFGDRSYVVHFRAGAIEKIDQGLDAESCYAFALRAPVETWSRFVQPEPPPMYNDIIAMSHQLHGRLKIEGDVKQLWQNLRAFTWALDLMRSAG
jgi:hypothetical protein